MNATASISAAFLAARREARALSAFPGEVPPTLDTAYAVQARSIRDWGEPVVGFKVGGVAPAFRDRYPSAWLAGPVFESALLRADVLEPTEIAVFEGGFAAYEPELVLRLSDLRAERPHLDTVEEALPFVSAVHLGAEIASSPLATLNALGPGSIISDFGNQAAVVVGPAIELSWLDRLADVQVTTIVDGAEVGRSHVKPDDAGPLGALRFLLNHLRDSGFEANGAWLSSGAITGVHEAKLGSSCTIVYEDLGVLKLRMRAKEPATA